MDSVTDLTAQLGGKGKSSKASPTRMYMSFEFEKLLFSDTKGRSEKENQMLT